MRGGYSDSNDSGGGLDKGAGGALTGGGGTAKPMNSLHNIAKPKNSYRTSSAKRCRGEDS